MNVANTDYIQATIELFGFFLTVIIAMIFQIITTNEKKSKKNLFMILLLAGFTLLVDAGWYISDGNISRISVITNRFCNLALFLCNPFMITFLGKFLYSLIREEGYKVNKCIVIIIQVILCITLIIPLSNLIYPWMYYFDEQNIYHRNFGWFIYTALLSIAMITCFIMVVMHKNYISKRRRYAIYFFLLAPLVGIALQSTKIGISFIQFGTVIGSLGILFNYLIDWIQTEKNIGDATYDKKRLWLIECVFGIMIVFVSAAIVSFIVSVHKVSNKNSEQSSMALSFMVSETVNGALSEPINVSRTMANSHIIVEALSKDNLEGSETEKQMLSFMKRIKDEYGYQMIFVASEKTKAYYTFDGLSRYMKVETDPKDAWYNEFKARNIRYELNIDEDKDNDMTLAVFVNMEVRNDKNELIGVCGAATSIESLLQILYQYEETYSLDIYLTDEDGIIQVDIDKEKIGTKLVSDLKLNSHSENITYTKNKVKARLTKYMKNLDWYLIIDDKNPDKLNLFEIIYPSMIIYILGILIMVTFSFGFGIFENRRSRILRTSKLLSETDKLTGVKNRNAFESFKKKLNQTTKNQIIQIVMIDINGLKTVNDKLGHIAGDELIIGATRCIKSAFGNIGEVYRIGGDEFVIISTSNKDLVEEKIKQLQSISENWCGDLVKELSMSVGLSSSEDKNITFDELVKTADERMYADKNEYYRRTGKDRRMSW